MLYNVDDLRAQAEENLRQREKGVDPAMAIIERETPPASRPCGTSGMPGRSSARSATTPTRSASASWTPSTPHAPT